MEKTLFNGNILKVRLAKFNKNRRVLTIETPDGEELFRKKLSLNFIIATHFNFVCFYDYKNNFFSSNTAWLTANGQLLSDDYQPFAEEDFVPAGIIATNKINGLTGLIDFLGNEIIPCGYKDIIEFKKATHPGCPKGWFALRKSSDLLMGLANKEGNIVIPAIYDDISFTPFHIIAEDSQKNYFRFYDFKGTIKGELEKVDFDKKNNVYKVMTKVGFDILSSDLKSILPNEVQKNILKDTFVFTARHTNLFNGGKVILYPDKEGRIRIYGSKNNHKKGNDVSEFDDMWFFKQQICEQGFALLNQDWVIFDKQGNALASMLIDDLKLLPEGIVLYKRSFSGKTKQGFMDWKGKLLYPITFDEIVFKKGVALGKNNSIFDK